MKKNNKRKEVKNKPPASSSTKKKPSSDEGRSSNFLDAASAIQYVEEQAKITPDDLDYTGGKLFKKINYLCNQDKMFTSVLEVVGHLAGAHHDKSDQPLPCVVGAMGQGKTELLHAIMRNHGNILAQIKDAYSTKKNTTIDHVLPLFVTFNMLFIYDLSDECSVSATGSLIARLLYIHLGCGSFEPSDCSKFQDVKLTEVLIQLAQRAHPGKKVLIVLLIDEVRKLVNDAGDKTKQKQLLDEVTRIISDKRLHFIPIVSSLEVAGLYDQVTAASGRPLYPISLPPCPRSELDVITKHVHSSSRCVHVCGGHFRTIERILYKNYSFTSMLVDVDILGDTLKLLGEILSRYPKPLILYETSAFGGGTLWDIVKQGEFIFYANVTADGLVTPTIAPYALMSTGVEYEEDNMFAQYKCLPLFAHLYRLVGEMSTHSFDVYRKHWEMAVPIAEALFGGLTGALPPYLRGKGLTAPARDDYGITVVRPLTESEQADTTTAKKYSITAEREEMKSILQKKVKYVFCPRVPTYPGIDALSTVFSVAVLYQMKQYTDDDSTPNLDSFADKLLVEAGNLGLKKGEYIGVIDIIGVPKEHLMKANEKYNKVNVFFLEGTTIVDTLKPLIGTYTPRFKK